MVQMCELWSARTRTGTRFEGSRYSRYLRVRRLIILRTFYLLTHGTDGGVLWYRMPTHPFHLLLKPAMYRVSVGAWATLARPTLSPAAPNGPPRLQPYM